MRSPSCPPWPTTHVPMLFVCWEKSGWVTPTWASSPLLALDGCFLAPPPRRWSGKRFNCARLAQPRQLGCCCECRMCMIQGTYSVYVCARAGGGWGGVVDVQAIGEWHKTRVLHLDIKPANIAVDSHGDVVVLDAGVSRFADEGTVDVRTPLGTPGYIAPELCHAGTATATTASDVYSLGVTLRSAIDKWASASSPDQVRAVLPVSCCFYH